MVDEEWFESQYDDLSRIKITPVVSNFRIIWDRLDIVRKETQASLGISASNKRIPVYDKNNLWVDTEPFDVTDFAGQERKVEEYKLNCLQKENEEYRDNLAQKDREISHLKSKVASLNSKE